MKKLSVFSLIFSFLFILSCEDKKDTTPPEVTITSPSNDSKVNEVVTVTCMSTDNKEVTKVELWVDGVNTGLTDETEPYSFKWNTTEYKDGDHTLIVRGYDSSDNEGDSPPVKVNVDNTVSVPVGVSVKSVSFLNGGFSIDWSKSTDGDFKSYSVEHSIESGMEDYEDIFTTEDVNVTNTRMENVSPLTFHYFRVTVTDTFLYQTKGSIYSTSLDPVPNPVHVKSVTYDLEKMTVEWEESNESDFGSYKLLYSKTESGDKDTIETYTDKSTTSYSTSTYDPLIENWYWVIVSDTLGQSEIGNGKTNNIDSPPTISIITSVKYYDSKNTFEIDWTRNEDSDFKSYTLYESDQKIINNDDLYKLVTIETNDPSVYERTKIQRNTKKYYKVVVEDKWGLKSESNNFIGSSFLNVVYSRGKSIYVNIEMTSSDFSLTPITLGHGSWMSWSHDGKRLVYRTSSEEIKLMDLDKENQKVVYKNSMNGPSKPVFSSNDSKIYFNNYMVLFSVDTSGQNLQTINWSGNSNYNNQIEIFDISPDDQKIVIENSNKIIYYDIVNDISHEPIEGNKPKWINNDEFIFVGVLDDSEGNCCIREILKSNGNTQTRLTSFEKNHGVPDKGIGLSNDKQKIVFRMGNDLWVVFVDGSKEELINSNGNVQNPIFTPDDKSIIYVNSDDWGVYSINYSDGSYSKKKITQSSDVNYQYYNIKFQPKYPD